MHIQKFLMILFVQYKLLWKKSIAASMLFFLIHIRALYFHLIYKQLINIASKRNKRKRSRSIWRIHYNLCIIVQNQLLQQHMINKLSEALKAIKLKRMNKMSFILRYDAFSSHLYYKLSSKSKVYTPMHL